MPATELPVELPAIGRTYYLEDGRAFVATAPLNHNQCTGCAFFGSFRSDRDSGCPNPVQEVPHRVAGLPNCLDTSAPTGSQHRCIYRFAGRRVSPDGKPLRKWPKFLPD